MGSSVLKDRAAIIISNVSRNVGWVEACNVFEFPWVASSETTVYPFLRLCNAVSIYLAAYLGVHETVTRDLGKSMM